jgi:hypothetical protein
MIGQGWTIGPLRREVTADNMDYWSLPGRGEGGRVVSVNPFLEGT